MLITRIKIIDKNINYCTIISYYICLLFIKIWNNFGWFEKWILNIKMIEACFYLLISLNKSFILINNYHLLPYNLILYEDYLIKILF